MDSVVLVDVELKDGLVASVTAACNPDTFKKPGVDVVNMREGMVLPTLVDLHTHIGTAAQQEVL